MKIFLGLFILILVLSFLFREKTEIDYIVGVGRSSIQSRIDLTDQLNPQILPSILEKVLASIPIKQGKNQIKSKDFQQKVVQNLSQTILNDPEANYRVDLNEDGIIDPLMILPENIDGEAVIYSLRVPDPQFYPKDPEANANWDEIAKKQSIEIVELNLALTKDKRGVAISSKANSNVYQNSDQNSYQQTYPTNSHSWIQTYFQYRLFSAMLFSPYGWGFGSFYGGFYRSYYHPATTASRPYRSSSRYSRASQSSSKLKTASGRSIQSKKSINRSNSSIRSLKSKRNLSIRNSRSNIRSGGFGRQGNRQLNSRSRSSFFSGGGSRGGWGK